MDYSRLVHEDDSCATSRTPRAPRFKGGHGQYSLNPGTVVDNRYQIVRPIGMGGVSAVYLARDLSLNCEEVALKILSKELSRDQEIFFRFKNEVVLSRRLSHPHIARVFDFGKDELDMHYYVLEYVSGGNLWDLLRRTPLKRLDYKEALKILMEVALALDYAHRNGILHRDVKPENILITTEGTAKLSDFGAARMMRIEKGITGAGSAIGTPHYMSPEALRGEKTDARSDIYSFGVMAFEILAGYSPFDDESPLQLVTKHLNSELPQISASGAELPDWIQDFLELCTEKKPDDRFQSMSELIKVLWDQLAESGEAPQLTILPPSLRTSKREPSSVRQMFASLLNR